MSIYLWLKNTKNGKIKKFLFFSHLFPYHTQCIAHPPSNECNSKTTGIERKGKGNFGIENRKFWLLFGRFQFFQSEKKSIHSLDYWIEWYHTEKSGEFDGEKRENWVFYSGKDATIDLPGIVHAVGVFLWVINTCMAFQDRNKQESTGENPVSLLPKSRKFRISWK